MNIHGSLNVGESEFNPYLYYGSGLHLVNYRFSVLNTFCLDLVPVSKIFYDYIYCQVDAVTFDKVYSEEIRKALFAGFDTSHSQAPDLDCLDDDGNLVLPIFVQHTKIRDAKSTEILRNIEDDDHQMTVPPDLSRWLKVGDYLSMTVCARDCLRMHRRLRLHAINIWVYEKSSEVIQSLVKLAGSALKPHNMNREGRNGIIELYHPLYQMIVPSKIDKDYFYKIFTRISREHGLNCPSYSRLDLMAFRTFKKDNDIWWFHGVLQCWLNQIQDQQVVNAIKLKFKEIFNIQ